ncbi:ATP-binding protein [Streptomyces sp. NPDC048211]|uniref:ATP-binding protein n=1 Tax=Streptomyces sp. NPDC048211 TaxID=3365516 RepID=UPI003721CE7C
MRGAGAHEGEPDEGVRAGDGRPGIAGGWEPPLMRGRDDALALIDDSLRRLERLRSPEVIVIKGAAGSGRTRLLKETCALAREAGMHAFRGGGDPDGQLAPMGPLLDALLTTGSPVLDRSALRAGATAADQRFWLLREMQNRLERAALERPLVVAVDDVQWCDEATLTALRELPKLLSGHAVLWVLASRAEASEPAGPMLDRLVEGGAREISLAPLSSDAVADVVADLLSAAPGPDVLEAARGAEGRPLLLVELVRGLWEEELVVVEDGRARLADGRVPLRFRDSVDQRLQQVSPTAQELVRVASALGRETPVALLAELMDRGADELGPAVREALGTDLMTGDGTHLRFRHDLVKEAVTASVPTTVRRLLRRRAAELRLRDGAPEVEVALLVAESAEPGDRRAIGILRRAAAELSAGEPSMAADISRSALRLAHDGTAERGLLLAETVSLLWQSGRAAEARTMSAEALEGLLEPEAEGRIRLELARVSSLHSFTEAVGQCRSALSLPGLSPGLRAQLLAMLCVALANSGEVLEAERTLEPARRAARNARDLSAEATVLSIESVVRFYRFDVGAALRTIEEAIEIADRLDGPTQSLLRPWRSMLLSSIGDAGTAIDLVDAHMRRVLTDGDADLARMLLMTRCRLLLDAGRLPDARAEAEAVLSMAGELGPGNFADSTAQYTLGRVARHRGDPTGLRAAAGHARRMRGDDSALIRNTGAWLGALVADATGDLAAVGHCTRYAAESFEGLGPALAGPEDPTDQALYVRITLRAGLRDRAEAAVGTAERRAAAGRSYPVLAAAAAHARALLTGDVPLLRRAADLLEGCSHRIARASALEDLGAVLAAAGDREAVDRLDRALELYAGAGADRDVARVRHRLRGIGVRRGSPDGERRFGLTASELKVVRLIARGATNRAAAETLFLSPHTVSSHLRHAFAKLGVNSRVALARALADLEEEGHTGTAG